MKPVKIRGILPVADHILELVEASAHMIKYSVKHYTDPIFMKLFTYLLKILIGSQSDIKLLIISGVIAMCVGFKYR